MLLYLVRHGKATSEQENPKRPLSKVGRQEVTQIAEYLKTKNIEVDAIWHSNKERAIETAHMIAEALERKELCEARDGFNPNDPVQKIGDEITGMAVSEDGQEGLLIVGHLPFVAKLVSYLLTGNMTARLIEFQSAGVACLKADEEGKWSFEWAVHPGML